MGEGEQRRAGGGIQALPEQSDIEQRAYERGYIDALRKARQRLSGSGAFNCGSHRGFEYPDELVAAMLDKALKDTRS